MSVILNGWLVSPYSAKVRSYLRYKQVDFEDRTPSARRLYMEVGKAVGRVVMPTVELADGTWLQDSSDIIDHFEARDPERAVVPDDGPVAVASALLELFGDEWLPMSALHYRWHTASNRDFALSEFARDGFPRVPGFVSRRLIRPMSRRMAGYLPALGVTSETIPGVETMTLRTIAALDHTLSEHPYLLGGRPSLGDFAIYGPLWAHLYRDPGSRALFDRAPAVVAWMDRLRAGATPDGPFLDEVPATMDPIFEAIIDEQLAWVRTLVEAIDTYCAQHPEASRVPRSLGTAPFEIGGIAGERKLATFVQWKAQRSRGAYEAAEGRADEWLRRFSERAPAEVIPAIQNPFERVDFKERLKPRGLAEAQR